MTDVVGRPIVYSDEGRPAWDPLVVFKMLLLQRYHPAADIKVEERAYTDLAYRLFLGIPFPVPVPDSTTLSVYRKFWGDSKVKRIFQNIFQQIQSLGAARVILIHFLSVSISINDLFLIEVNSFPREGDFLDSYSALSINHTKSMD